MLMHREDSLPTGDWPEYLTQPGPLGIFDPEFTSRTTELLTSAYSEDIPRYGIPEYALDKHTMLGSKNLRRGIPHFYGIGDEESPEKIENPDPVWQSACTWLLQNVIYPRFS